MICPIYMAAESEFNKVNDGSSPRCCRWNRSCCCYTSKEANIVFSIRIVFLLKSYRVHNVNMSVLSAKL
jgi:hypothetical protein